MFSPSREFRSFGLVLLSLGLAYPGTLLGPRARLLCSGSVRPATCCAPPVTCCAPPPPPDVCTCTTYKPVCDTCYHQQPIVTYHDVCRTCYRQEPYCVTVPVTKVDCITCDEGCYKMVWCPHIVTKQVPRTEYRQQTCCRTVPYTVTQRVPQVMMQTVPEYRVRYCPETHTYIKPPCNPCPCCPMPCAPGCGARLPTWDRRLRPVRRRKRSPRLRPCSRSSPRPRAPPFNWLRSRRPPLHPKQLLRRGTP